MQPKTHYRNGFYVKAILIGRKYSGLISYPYIGLGIFSSLVQLKILSSEGRAGNGTQQTYRKDRRQR